jgi:Flp pilus assembly protein CpaB
MRKRLLVAATAAALAMVLGWLYLRNAELHATGGRMTMVLVAGREIPAGTRLSAADLAIREIPEAYLHPESVQATSADEKKILGRVVAVPMVQGQPLLWTDLDNAKSKLSRRLAGAIQKGQRAFAMAVDPSNSFGNQLRGSDRVDVMYTFNRPGYEGTVTILQNVLVLAVSGKREDQMVDGEPQMTVTHVTLSLDPDEAEILGFAMLHGTIQLLLHGDDDIDVVTDLRQKNFSDLIEDGKRSAMAARRTKKRITPLMPDKGPGAP